MVVWGGFVAFTFGPDGRLYASMFNGSPQCILRYDGMTGAFVDVFACAPDSSSAFSGLAFGSDGHLYASRYHQGVVWQLDGSSGKLLWTLHCTGDIRADYLGFGPDGRLYVSNLTSNNASRFDVHTGKCLVFYPVAGEISFGKGFVFTPGKADIFLRAIPSATTVHQGDLLTYAFPIWNLGPGNAFLEVLNTQVPAGTIFEYVRISGTPGVGTCTRPPYHGTGQVVCQENSAMAVNTTWTVRLTVKVTAPAGTVITANAATTADTPDPNMGNNMASASLQVQ